MAVGRGVVAVAPPTKTVITETLSSLINTPVCILGKMLLDEDPATVCPYFLFRQS